jgi:hypothetical protein
LESLLARGRAREHWSASPSTGLTKRQALSSISRLIEEKFGED